MKKTKPPENIDLARFYSRKAKGWIEDGNPECAYLAASMAARAALRAMRAHERKRQQRQAV